MLNNDVDYLLTSYCEEFKKDSHKTIILIALLKQMGIFNINNYIEKALNYYMEKYNVLILLDKQQNIIKIL